MPFQVLDAHSPFPCFGECVKMMSALDQHLWELAKGATTSPAGC